MVMFSLLPPNEDLSYKEMVGRKDLLGYCKNLPVKIEVFNVSNLDLDTRERVEELSRLRHSRLSCVFLEDLGDFCAICWERSKIPSVYDISFTTFKQTKQMLDQVLQAVNWVHQQGYLHTGLMLTSSFLFEHQPEYKFLSVKLDISKCVVDDGSLSVAHTRASNFNHLASGLSDLLQIDGFVPRIKVGLVTKRVFAEEIQFFLDELKKASFTDTHPFRFRNHPIFWTSERRLCFLQDVFLSCKKYTKLGEMLCGIALDEEVGFDWSCFDMSVCKDLALVFERGDGSFVPVPVNAFNLLKGIRHFFVHSIHQIQGLEFYRELDVDVTKGLDLLISFWAPTFFRKVHSTLLDYSNKANKQSEMSVAFLKYWNFDFDPASASC